MSSEEEEALAESPSSSDPAAADQSAVAVEDEHAAALSDALDHPDPVCGRRSMMTLRINITMRKPT